MTTQTIFKKITAMESELQKLKLEAYWQLSPKHKQGPESAAYPEKAVLKAVRSSRNDIWRKRYAKKV